MAEVTIEELTPANQHEAASLIRAGLAEHWGALDPDLNPDLDDLIESYRHGRTILVRRPPGPLLGTGTILPRGHGTAEILRMSVAPDARRLGIGRRIVDELIATARTWNADRVVLETTSAWTDVVAFYLRCGFTITHTEMSEFGPETHFAYDLDLSR